MSVWLSRQSRFIIAAFLLLVISGAFAMSRLPVGLFPTIQFPRLSVSLEAGDRPVDQMEAQVTRPVEEALRDVQGPVVRPAGPVPGAGPLGPLGPGGRSRAQAL